MMRKPLALILSIISTVLINAQDKWAHYYTTIAGPIYEMGEFCGDTIIDNKEYDFIIHSFFRLPDLTPIGSSRNGYRRVSNDSVFILHATEPGNTEKLYYVFNLKVGDAIILDVVVTDTFHVIKVDTVNLLGKDRRRMYLSNLATKDVNEDIWVEDIGSIIHGYLWPGLPDDISDLGSAFSCYYDSKSNQTYAPYDSLPCHMDKLEKACSIPNSTEDESQKNKYVVSPNPFHDVIDIYLHSFPAKLALYNVSGILIQEASIQNHYFRMESKELSAGLYIMKLTDGRQTEIIKLIKN